jgi:hypothetical protein
VARLANASRITMQTTVEIEGMPRPALVAETISIIYDAAM